MPVSRLALAEALTSSALDLRGRAAEPARRRGQGNLIATAMDEVQCGAATARQLLELSLIHI